MTWIPEADSGGIEEVMCDNCEKIKDELITVYREWKKEIERRHELEKIVDDYRKKMGEL